MQIKFKTAYPINTSPIVAQTDLLGQWSKSCEADQIKFIKQAVVEFTDYDMREYPNQIQLKKEYATYLSTFNSDYSDENVNRCFKEFAKKFRILELTITPEDYS